MKHDNDTPESITRLAKCAPQPPSLATSDPQEEEWERLRASLERFWNTKPQGKFPPNLTEDELHRDRETGLAPVDLNELRRQIDALVKTFDQAARSRPFLDPDPNPPKFGLEADAPTPAPRDSLSAHQVITVKCLRRDMDGQLQILNALPPSRERSLAITKIQEGVMWLGMDLNRIATENPGYLPDPYPHSKDPSNAIIDPPAEELRRKP